MSLPYMGDDWMLISNLIDNTIAGTNTCLPGFIKAFYPERQTVDVTPAIQSRNVAVNGTTSLATLPTLYDIPVVFPQAGGFALTFPVTAGDSCVLIFAQRAIDNWHENGGVQPPEDGPWSSRHHALNDAFAIMGVSPIKVALQDWDTDGISLRNSDGSIKIKISDKVEILSGTSSITIDKDATVTIDGETVVNNKITHESETVCNAAVDVNSDLHVTGNAKVDTGWTGQGVTVDGKVLVFMNGICVSG